MSGLERDLQTGEKDTQGFLGKIGNSLNQALSTALGVGLYDIAKGLVTGAFDLVKNAIGSVIAEASEAELVQTQLDAVLRSTGGAAGVTAAMVNDLAAKYQGMTRFSDDAVISGENVLLTFTKIGKDIFPEATGVMLDMSTALGQDLKASAIQLGKALQDPVEGVTALKRVGVNFSDSQMRMIERMVAAGNVMGAQKLILEELKTEFGGSAEAAGNTFAGKMDILKNKFSDFQETVGGYLLDAGGPLLDQVTGLADEWLPKVADGFAANVVPAINKAGAAVSSLLAGDVGGALKTLLPPELLDTMDSLGLGADDLQAAFERLTAGNWRGALRGLLPPDVSGAIIGGVDDITAGIGNFGQMIQDNLPWLQEFGGDLLGGIVDGLGGLGEFAQSEVLPFLGEQLGGLGNWFVENTPLIQAYAGDILDGLQGTFGQLSDVILGAWPTAEAIAGILGETFGGLGTAFLQVAQGDWDGAWVTLMQTANNVWAGVQSAALEFANWVLGWLGTDWETVKTTWQGNWDSFSQIVSTVWTNITTNLNTYLDNAQAAIVAKAVAWIEAGKALVQGLIDGIAANAQALVDKVNEVVQGAIDSALAALGIKSPSKVFAEIGMMVGAGMTQGIQASAAGVNDAVAGLVDTNGLLLQLSPVLAGAPLAPVGTRAAGAGESLTVIINQYLGRGVNAAEVAAGAESGVREAQRARGRS